MARRPAGRQRAAVAASGMLAAVLDACRREVTELHRFIEEWLTGRAARTQAAFARFAEALAEDFVILHPTGARSSRAEVVAGFFAAHGVGGPDLRVRVLHREARTLAPGLALVTYEEWHEGPVLNGRLATAVLRTEGRGPVWVHLHESALPAEQSAAP